MLVRQRWTVPSSRRTGLAVPHETTGSTKMGVRELVCCFQPVLLSNSDGSFCAVSCHAGQASLLNQIVGFPVALSPYAPHHLSARWSEIIFLLEQL